MGCNSSTPNIIATVPTFSDENSISKEAEVKLQRQGSEGIKLNESNEIKVLPTCDTLDSSIQLAVDNKYTDVDATGIKSEQEMTKANENIVNEEKLTKIEEVVEKVVTMFITPDKIVAEVNDKKNADTDTQKDDDDHEIDVKHEALPDEIKEASNENITSVTEDNVENSETDSQVPSESEIIVTRWEALADIAAELPPLLAVDAVTGQIYSLSK